jgi:hypothetical protein
VAEVQDETPLKTDGETTAEKEKQEERREDIEKDK